MATGEVLAELTLQGDDEFQNSLESIDSGMGEVEGGAEDASGSLTDLGGSLDETATGLDQAAQPADDLATSLFEVDAAGMAAGAGIAGVGAAVQGTIGSTQDWRESLGRTSQTMGMTQTEAEGLANSISNATFPMDDAVGTMDALARQGITTEAEMRSVAATMDSVADATGTTAQSVAENAAPAMRAFGIDLKDAGEHADTFTYIARNTTMGVEDFSSSIERMAPELQEMGLSLDDTAAIMAALEEKGITGRQAITEFRKATNKAGGSQEELYNQLGLSEQAVAEQSQAIADAEGITREHAAAANESVTTMDRLGQTFDEIKLAAGGMLAPMDALGPALMGMGGAASALSAINVGALIPSLGGVLAALTPLLPVILPLIAVTGVLAAAWATNFGDIQGKTEAAAQAIQAAIGNITEWLGRLGEIAQIAIQGDFATAFEEAEQLVRDTISGIGTWLQSSAIPMLRDAMTALATGAIEALGTLKDQGIQIVTDAITGIVNYVTSLGVADVKAAFKAIGTGIRETVLTFLSVGGTVWTVVTDFIAGIAHYLKNDAVGDLKAGAEAAFDALVEGGRIALEALTPPDGIIVQTIEGIAHYLRNDAVGDLAAAIETVIDVFIAAFEGLYEGLIGGSLIPEMFVAIKDYIITTATGLITTAIQGYVDAATAIFETWWDLIGERFVTFFDGILADLGAWAETFLSDTVAFLSTLFDDFSEWWQSIRDDVATKAEGVKDDVLGFMGDMKDSVVGPGGIIPNLKTAAVDLIEAIGSEGATAFKRAWNNAIPSSMSIPSISIDVPEALGGGTKSFGGGSVSLPQLATGGLIEETGRFVGHAGERVLNPAETKQVSDGVAGGGDEIDITIEGTEITIEGDATEETIELLDRKLDRRDEQMERKFKALVGRPHGGR